MGDLRHSGPRLGLLLVALLTLGALAAARRNGVQVEYQKEPACLDGEPSIFVYDVTLATGRHFVEDGHTGLIQSGEDFDRIMRDGNGRTK